MARIISTDTVNGITLNKTIERKATGIRIILDPRAPMRMALEFSDNVIQTITVPGNAPVVTVLSVTPVGELDVTAEEMSALPCFAEVYAQLKTLADAKSAERWPTPAEEQA